MKIQGAIKHYILGKSIKEIEADRILDKISKGKELSDRERGFLDLYNITSNDLTSDFMFLSKNIACDKINYLLKNDKLVICDLCDRNGKFGLRILDIVNNYEDNKSIIYMSGDEKFYMTDRCLYNIIYDIKRNKYSLQLQDEYYEKVNVEND